MNVYITFDYEIYFGEQHGTVQKNLIEPTERILAVAKQNNAQFTFFIDCGFLLKLKEWGEKYPPLKGEYNQICQQIKEIKKEGHDCQLHIHPHWEKTIYDGEKWIFDYQFYKLSDFPAEEATKIIHKYTDELERITEDKVSAYRAGGWCVQPFSLLQSAFEKRGIRVDSSVFKGGKAKDEHYFYDYTQAPEKDKWNFSSDVCVEIENGFFTELPISSFRYSPLFFWRLFVLGRLFPMNHKPMGDGKPMPSNLTRRKMLSQWHYLSANVDGYFITKANRILRRNKKLKYVHTVFLGHPKAATHFSIQKIGELIQKNKNWCSFVPVSSEIRAE